jgi:hypothetical protein
MSTGHRERVSRRRARAWLTAFRNWLRARDLAVIVTRNVTTRDAFDFQQPFNLRVPVSGGVQTRRSNDSSPFYDVAHLQIVQADQIRGMGGPASPNRGRRPIAQFLHEPSAQNPPNPSGPAGSVAVAADGSIAALAPAHRALSWQLTDASGKPVVHERYWLTMQPGEVRACTSCHGLSHLDQAGNPPPTNPPQALGNLLQYWKQNLAPAQPAGSTPATRTAPPAARRSTASVPACSSPARAAVFRGRPRPSRSTSPSPVPRPWVISYSMPGTRRNPGPPRSTSAPGRRAPTTPCCRYRRTAPRPSRSPTAAPARYMSSWT